MSTPTSSFQLPEPPELWIKLLETSGGEANSSKAIEDTARFVEALARLFQTVLVGNVPVFDEKKEDQARRFISLVDEFYDRNVKLIISAEAPILELYQGSRLTFEFQRTESRLQEMQSKEYLAQEHRP